MSHSLVKVYIHYVWTTKKRERALTGDARRMMKEHIADYAYQHSIKLEALDVQPEHVHVCVRLSHDQQIDVIIKLLKGESSHWINQNDVLPGKFSWQTGYAAFSVSHNGVEAVKAYISGQDEHHKRRSFTEEFAQIVKEAGYTEEEIALFLKD